MNIACLLSDAYGGFGGISRFNQDFLEALDRCSLVSRTIVFPRVILEHNNQDPIPESVLFVRNASKSRSAYVLSIIKQSLLGPTPDLVICGHINLLPIAYLYARIIRRRLILIVHGIDAWAPTPRRMTNMIVKKTDMIVSVSAFTANKLVNWSHIAKEKIFILPNCVDLDRFTPKPRDAYIRQRFGWSDHHLVLMTLGRLASAERYKGFDEVLEVLPELLQHQADIRYLIVGDGSDRKRLSDKVASLGLQNIVAFAGRIDDDERTAFYNAADLYVMPSQGEGFGIVLLEAAACGLPIIGSTADGSAEALRHGKLGRLIDPKDRDALKDAICETLRFYPTRARLEAVSYFSQKAYRKRVEDLILRSICESRSSDSSPSIVSNDRAATGPSEGHKPSW